MICKICNKSFSSLGSHIRHSHKEYNNKKYYDEFMKKNGEGICKECGKPTNFISLSKGYYKYCSVTCSSRSKETMKKRKFTTLKRYGNENYRNVELAKQTNLERYGVAIPTKLKEIQDKTKKTNLERYGVTHHMYSEDIKNKVAETNMKKYGVKTILQSDDIRKKVKNTCLRKYGVDNVFKSDIIRAKSIESIRNMSPIEKQHAVIKRKNTLKNKYGKTNYNNIKKSIEKRYYNKFESLLNSNILSERVTPLFSLDEYKGIYEKYNFLCNKCNKVFSDSLEKGKIPRCLNCYPLKNNSMFQKEVYEYVNSIYDEVVIENDRKILNGLELDIYLPNKNLAIECNGLYYHSEISGRKDKNYHLNKTISCENEGIQLIHIFEDEWINKSNIVKMRLKNILGLNDDRIYGKQCIVSEIDNIIKSNFLNNYHIQGTDKSSIRLGLFNNNNIVGVMTFGKRRLALGKKSTEKGEYELLRYATSRSVIGGAGKLLNYFVKKYQPTKIISYADRRWSQGNLYEKLGFNLASNTPVNYWYFDKNHMRLHRFNFRKNILNEKLEDFDSALSEWQNMQLNGYDRIWDCGSLKYEMFIGN